MDYEAWHYFLSIEKDFIRTIDFVHLTAANASAFSMNMLSATALSSVPGGAEAGTQGDRPSLPTLYPALQQACRTFKGAFAITK